MPRPRKNKRICKVPEFKYFICGSGQAATINMTCEEYECIRLIDFEGLDQNECAVIMGVGRSSVQRLYESARKIIANSLVEGKRIKIEGGEYDVCPYSKDTYWSCNKNCMKDKNKSKKSL
ncbi:MAG: DUF134 domain-containing protein [Eubacteriaceae bacterium]|nr:DUF134 domain-containing protein [Eubacteriaceae bacterium]